MKKLIYQIMGYTSIYNPETEEMEQHPSLARIIKENPIDEDIQIAKKEAYNGEYTIEDDGMEEVSTPSQLDRIEAQVTYTAMMTDTLLEAE